MRIWRDIPPTQQWETAVKHLYKTLFTHNAVTRLTTLITQYHHLDKTAREHIGPRVHFLTQIQSAAVEFLKSKGIETKTDLEKKAGSTPDFKEADFRGVVWVVARRAGRKADYLRKLGEYYETNRHQLGNAFEAVQLMEHKPIDDGLLGLSREVLMEQIDPLHRNYEMQFEDSKITEVGSAISAAFRDWFQEFKKGTTDRPFFLWLEAHPICTAQGNQFFQSPMMTNDPNSMIDFKVKEVTSVRYTTDEWVGLVGARDGLLYTVLDEEWAFETKDTTEGVPLDTTGITKSKSGDGFAAFVWTKNYELVVDQHVTSQVHHSTLAGGDRVRCAGMIKVVRGKVAAVSNNSGHYRPTTHHLQEFVNHLRELQVLDHNAQIKDVTGNHN